MLRRATLTISLLALVSLMGSAAAQEQTLPIDPTIPEDPLGPEPIDPETPQDPAGEVDTILDEAQGNKAPSPAPPGSDDGIGEIGRDVAQGFADNWLLTGGVLVGLGSATLLFFVLASRYVDPKEALKNSQRSMLYGFVKGNPGVHLKQLSTEFSMKTSTVLWHVRKLECADLVRSKKANGYRVFYPVSGGMEARQLSTAITALSNDNARDIFQFVALQPGAQQREVAESLDINPGTVRWHLKKLRSAGLTAELTQERTSAFYATELGIKAMRQVAGLPPGIEAPLGIRELAEEGMPMPN